MDREGFRSRMKQYKKAREENPGLKYWEWKNIPKYDEGVDKVTNNLSWWDKLKANVSTAIMNLGHQLALGSVPTRLFSSANVAQDSYLVDRKLLQKMFESRGYTKVDNDDYGLVRKAVGNRNIPVFQRKKDTKKREDLVVLDNLYNIWHGSTDSSLEHAGNYPSTVYVDKDGWLYQKAWDLNDYGETSAGDGGFKYGSIQEVANTLDKIGSPTVVTTGFQPVINNVFEEKPVNAFDIKKHKSKFDGKSYTNILSDLLPLLDYSLLKKGLRRIDLGDSYTYGLPEIEVRPKKYVDGGLVEDDKVIRTEKDNEVSEWNRAVYSAINPTWGVPKTFSDKFWALLKVTSKDFADEENKMDYEVGETLGEKSANEAWRHYHGLSYDSNILRTWNGDTLRLHPKLEAEIPTDTVMLKKRIAVNKQLLNKYDKYKYSDIINAAISADEQQLNALRKTYSTGQPVGVNELSTVNRSLVKDGEINENWISPLNTFRNYNIRWDKDQQKMYYSKSYDFDVKEGDSYDWILGGTPFYFRGVVPKHAEGIDKVQPDPMDVLERSKPKVAGIPINDKPLSGTDPLGELYLNLVSGRAIRKAITRGINGMIRKSFYDDYKSLLKAGFNKQRAYNYASPELGIGILPGIAKGFDYVIKGANYTHAAQDFIE